MPTIVAPAFFQSTVKTLLFTPSKEGHPSLYPFDGVGIYDRTRFVRLGGFDSTLKSTYWQLMDFGFRSYLWGEQIGATQMIRLSYDGETPLENSSADESYRRFYLKNLTPVFHGDHAYIPLRRFLAYFWRSGENLFIAWDEFSKARRWVKTNRFRFRSDAMAITELWEDSSEHPELEIGGVEVPKIEPLKIEQSEIEPVGIEPQNIETPDIENSGPPES